MWHGILFAPVLHYLIKMLIDFQQLGISSVTSVVANSVNVNDCEASWVALDE